MPWFSQKERSSTTVVASSTSWGICVELDDLALLGEEAAPAPCSAGVAVVDHGRLRELERLELVDVRQVLLEGCEQPLRHHPR